MFDFYDRGVLQIQEFRIFLLMEMEILEMYKWTLDTNKYTDT